MLSALCLALALAPPADASAVDGHDGALAVSAGLSALMLQSYLFNHTGLALEASLDGRATGRLAWAIGGRLGLGRPAPEGFVPLSMAASANM